MTSYISQFRESPKNVLYERVFNQNITQNMNHDEVQHKQINYRDIRQSDLSWIPIEIPNRRESDLQAIATVEPVRRIVVAVQQGSRVNDQIKRDKDRDRRFYEVGSTSGLREETSWRQEDSRDKRSEEIRVLHQKVQLDNKKNTNALGYNPITLAYEESNRGEKLTKYDEKKEVNRHVRSKNIVEKNNQGFNIITREKKHVQNFTVPEKLRPLVSQKYADKKEREALKYELIRDKSDYLDD